MRRILAIIIASLVVGSLLLAALMPVWLPWAVRPALLAQGVRFGAYERHGFKRFVLRDLEAPLADAKLAADRVDLATPPVWLWRGLAGTAPSPPLLTIAGWRLTLPPPSPAPTPPAAGSLADLLHEIEAVLPLLSQWLPAATATDGSIQFADHQLLVPEVDWRQSTLTVQATWPPTADAAHLRIAWPGATAGQPLASATLTLPTRQAEATLALRRRDGRPQLEGFAIWQANRIELTAQFGSTGWWPQRATATAPALHVAFPALTAAGYAALNGSLKLDWQPDGYTLDMAAQAQPLQADNPLRPPIEATLRLAGDFQAVRIEQASLATPAADAKLAEPLPVDFRGQLGSDATIHFAADLAKWPAWPATGKLAATIRLQARSGGWPNLTFETTAPTVQMPGGQRLEQAWARGELAWPDKQADNPWPTLDLEATAATLTVAEDHRLEHLWARGQLAWPPSSPPPNNWPTLDLEATAATLTVAGFRLEEIRATSTFNWPWLNVASLTARQAEGATMSASASLDCQARRLESAELVADHLDLRHWLPSELAYDSLSLNVQASGPLIRPAHAGQLLLEGLRGGRLPSMRVAATWHGEGLDLPHLAVQATSPPGSIDMAASLSLADRQLAAQVERLTVAWEQEILARLHSPGALILAWDASPADWRLELRHWRWQVGEEGELTFDGACQWPAPGELEIAIRHLDLGRWPQPLPTPWSGLLIEHAQLEAAWANGPATFRAATTARWSDGDATELHLALRLAGDPNGIHIEAAELADPNGLVLVASGQLPATIEPAQTAHFLRWHDQAPLAIEATIVNATQIWDRLAATTGVHLRQPDAHLSISGTLANPQGRLQATADAVEIRSPALTLPNIEAVRLDMAVDSTHATLTSLTATVEGQPVRFEGSVPLSQAFWRQPTRPDTWPSLEQASARLEVAEAKIADFAHLLPSTLSPQGHLGLELALRPGLKLAGDLRLVDAATRAMLPIGPIRDIQAHFQLADRRADIVQFNGELAGQTVTVAGHLAWPVGGSPELSLHLLGQRVPLARQPGLILRADVDLQLTATQAGPPKLAGTLRPRDSFYLAEWRSLLPGQPLSVPRRPPFFSVTEEPFADWLLDVKIEGHRSLRVRTPLFRGELSPNLRLGGTLREPFAVGEVRVADGRLQFPFATITIVDGHVVLASDNPYRPQLFVTGTARAFDYDLRLQVSGFADAPVWDMSATPPLTPEAIVLLITAGEVPRDTITLSDRQRAGRLMFFLGRNLVSELWMDESSADRLTIRSGEAVTRDGRETYAVEYKLTDRWSLVGEYDQFNDINVGIKWRIYSK